MLLLVTHEIAVIDQINVRMFDAIPLLPITVLPRLIGGPRCP